VVEVQVEHSSAEKDNKDGLKQSKLEDVSEEDKEKGGSIGSGAF
jgi:hypothetical protein